MKKISLRTDIFSGEHALDYLKEIKNQRIFIVADPFISESNMIAAVEDRLKEGNNTWQVFDEVVPDPPVENVVAGVDKLQAFKPDHMITIGGGSAIDAAKAIKMFAGKIYDIDHLPLLAIPTTSGTGSEVTSFSIITDNAKGVKYPIVSDSLIPETAILDTNLVKSVPKAITADTGMDSLTHALEAYVAADANDFSDALAEKSIRLLFKYLPIAYQDGTNMEAREKVHHASTMAGIAFNTAGLGINHSIAHASGARFHIPHGRLNAILLPEVIAYNAGLKNGNDENQKRAAEKYAEIAKSLGQSATNGIIGTRNLIRKIEELRKKLDMPGDLRSYNLEYTNETKSEIAEAALQDSCTITNPVQPEKEDIIAILTKLL